MEKIEVKKINTDEIEDLSILFEKYQEFYKASVDKEKNQEFLQEILSDGDKGFFNIIYLNSHPVGFSGVYFSYSSVLAKRIAIINDLFILADSRKQGLGRTLMEKTIDLVKSAGHKNIRWCTKSDNLDAQNLYNNLDVSKSDWIHYDLKV